MKTIVYVNFSSFIIKAKKIEEYTSYVVYYIITNYCELFAFPILTLSLSLLLSLLLPSLMGQALRYKRVEQEDFSLDLGYLTEEKLKSMVLTFAILLKNHKNCDILKRRCLQMYTGSNPSLKNHYLDTVKSNNNEVYFYKMVKEDNMRRHALPIPTSHPDCQKIEPVEESLVTEALAIALLQSLPPIQGWYSMLQGAKPEKGEIYNFLRIRYVETYNRLLSIYTGTLGNKKIKFGYTQYPIRDENDKEKIIVKQTYFAEPCAIDKFNYNKFKKQTKHLVFCFEIFYDKDKNFCIDLVVPDDYSMHIDVNGTIEYAC